MLLAQNTNPFDYQTTNLLKAWFFALVFNRRIQRNKSRFGANFAGTIIAQSFSYQNSLTLPANIFLHRVFSLIFETKNRKYNNLKKTLSANPCYLYTNWRAFRLLLLFFESCRIFYLTSFSNLFAGAI